MASTSYMFRPEQYNWILRMADAHNLGFENKTLAETVEYALKNRQVSIDTKLRTMSRCRLEHSNWRRMKNCRLPERTARDVQKLASSYRVDFIDALSVIVGDASARISRDRALEESIFESPRITTCTSTLYRDLKRQRSATRARTR